MEKIRVNVTQKDINEGVAKDCEACPIARALMRAVKRLGATKVMIGRGVWDVEFADPSKSLWGYMPGEAKQFVSDFDRGYSVLPGRFTLTAVDTTAGEDNF